MNQPKQILIAPLDWGLGHTTRCIPIISALLAQQHIVTVAVKGNAATLIASAFPQIKIVTDIPNYDITYGKNKLSTQIKLLLQIVAIQKAIKKENRWLKKYIANYATDIVISDNRYGLYHSKVKTIFITHQLNPISPIGNWANVFLQKIIQQKIAKFNSCWVYDNAPPNALAGKLSHTTSKILNTLYIGVHTRLHNFRAEKKYDFACILSGPEPQRSMLQQKILAQWQHTTLECILVLGKSEMVENTNSNITIISLANDETINQIVATSKYIICRSGYTSVMDYLCVGAKCIFVPTPGQTEQEYLAQYLFEKKYCFVVTQSDFEFQELQNQLSLYTFANFTNNSTNALQQAIENL